MKKFSLFIILVIVGGVLHGCIGAGRGSAIVTDSEDRFPTVTGGDLTGVERTVPRDIPGDTKLVVVAFKREQQAAVDTWITHLPVIEKKFPGITFTELPVIEDGTAAFRLMVNNGMRSGITDENRRRQVITIYTDVRRFIQSIEVDSIDSIVTFVLDANGRIRSKVKGPFSSEAFAALTAGQ